MRSLCLDIATLTGWALGSVREGVVGYGVHKLPKTDDDVGRFLHAYRSWLGPLIEQCNIGEVCFEAPILPGVGNLTTLRKLYGLVGMTELVARDCGVTCCEANLSEIRPHFIGTSRAPAEIKGKAARETKTLRRAWLKRQTVLECRRRGFHVTTDDDADALALLSLRLSHYQAGYDMRAAPVAA